MMTRHLVVLLLIVVEFFVASNADKLKIAVLTAQTDDMQATEKVFLHQHEPYSTLFRLNKQHYASINGYTHVHTKIKVDDKLREIGIEWAKIKILEKHLHLYDWLCWLDTDTLIIDKYMKIEDFISSSDPNVDIILEGDWFRNELDGRSLKSGVFLIRNTQWSRDFLRKVLQWSTPPSLKKIQRRLLAPSNSTLDNTLAFLFSEPENNQHLRLTLLQERSSQWVVYLPRVGILHFAGCHYDNDRCIFVFDKVVYHLLNMEQLWIYRISPIVQQIYHFFVIVYLPFAIDRLVYVAAFVLLKLRAAVTTTKKSDPIGIDILPDDQCPFICVQLPMYNESSCCQSVIDAACKLDWPKGKLMVQVLDDSTDKQSAGLVDSRVAEWKERGANIELRRRVNRHGYKAGAMKEGLAILERAGVEFVAIFDADFLPTRDFLRRTVPVLAGDPRACFVQTRWTYTNAKQCLLTRMQEVLLNFHFVCEQQVRFATSNFFNFNGTAGLWRVSAIADAGGWQSDTLVEDLDLSLRAYVRGWKAIYLTEVECLNQIPPTFTGYRCQQRRWTSGPMQMLRKGFEIVYRSDLPWRRKLFCYWFFLRNGIHLVNFIYFLVLIPMMVWVPRTTTYDWAVTHLPMAISASNVLFSLDEWYHIAHFVVFENTMCLLKAISMVCGFFGLDNQWTVTPKFKNDPNKRKTFRLDWIQLYPAETIMGLFLLAMGLGGLAIGQPRIAIFCLLNGLGFAVVAIGYIGVE